MVEKRKVNVIYALNNALNMIVRWNCCAAKKMQIRYVKYVTSRMIEQKN